MAFAAACRTVTLVPFQQVLAHTRRSRGIPADQARFRKQAACQR